MSNGNPEKVTWLPVTKVVHLTSVHAPLDIRIFHKECRSLVEAGYSVTLVAPHNQDEQIGGVRIRAVPKPMGRCERMTRTLWQVYRAALNERAKVYHIHDPELIPVGALLRLRGADVVYDVHEDVPRQMLSKHWIPNWLRGAVAGGVDIAEHIAARLMSGIVAATPAIARKFPAHKSTIVQNFPLLGELDSPEALPYGERPPWLVYVGGITVIRGAFEMVRAMELVPDELNARLLLAGDFSPASLEEKLRGLPGWECTEYLGWQSRKQVASLLGRARVGLVVVHPVPNHVEGQPIKLFEYMSAGIPVIASDFPLWREIVGGAGCGLLVDPLNPTPIAKAVHRMLEHPEEAEVMGKRGQEAVHNRYNWGSEVQKLLGFYQRFA